MKQLTENLEVPVEAISVHNVPFVGSIWEEQDEAGEVKLSNVSFWPLCLSMHLLHMMARVGGNLAVVHIYLHSSL